FFSSRRRHTRSKRDWSSDVCSSDLPTRGWRCAGVLIHGTRARSLNTEATKPPRSALTSKTCKRGLYELNCPLHRVTVCKAFAMRSEERRVGKECRSWRGMDQEKRKE